MWKGEPVRAMSTADRRLWLLMGVYLLLSVGVLITWNIQGVNAPTGDEPHYMVIADALTRDGTPEVSESYAREFAEKRFYAPGLASVGANLEPPWAHVVDTSSGVFSWHGMGISALIAIPLAVGGIWAAKAVMLISGLIVLAAAWQLARWAGLSGWSRTAAIAGVGLGYPVVLAAGQVYPDLWAGALLLAFMAWLLIPRLRGPGVTAAVSLGIGALPWLGMKFAVPAVVAALAVAVLAWRGRERRLFMASALVPGALVGAALAVTNLVLYGSLLGPPVAGTLAFGRDFAMLLPGLILDQNQGLLLYNPLLWLGVLGVGMLFRRAPLPALVWAALFASLWVPAAAHPGLYGLGSFNGRYSWPLALLLIVPTLAALSWLRSLSRRGFWIVTLAGLLFTAFFLAIAVLPIGLSLYTKPMNSWLETYAFSWFPAQGFLPAWYSADWAFTYGPNWIWLALAIGLLVLGFAPGLFGTRGNRKPALAWGLIVLLAAIAAGFVFPATAREQVEQFDSALTAGSDEPGYVAVGPAWPMRLGTYEWFVRYRADTDAVVGKWELVRVADDSVVAAGELIGTQGETSEAGAALPYRSFAPREFVLRVGWYGNANIDVETTGVRHED